MRPIPPEQKDFDVFLCHQSADKPAVRVIGGRLKERGILPWLDEEQLQPGLPWQRALEKQIRRIKAAAVFVGENGRGPWQDLELDALLREFVRRKCPVIPVILTGAKGRPRFPVFLGGMSWIDFRRPDPDPLKQLIWGITGERGLGCDHPPRAGGSGAPGLRRRTQRRPEQRETGTATLLPPGPLTPGSKVPCARPGPLRRDA